MRTREKYLLVHQTLHQQLCSDMHQRYWLSGKGDRLQTLRSTGVLPALIRYPLVLLGVLSFRKSWLSVDERAYRHNDFCIPSVGQGIDIELGVSIKLCEDATSCSRPLLRYQWTNI